MKLPFTLERFRDAFEWYNRSVWPVQWFLVFLGILAIVLATGIAGRHSRAVSVILAFLWTWCGIVYHLFYFRVINPAAPVFAALFVVQGALFLWYGAHGRPTFTTGKGATRVAGWAMVTYALVLYPALGYLLDHHYPRTPTFGLPCQLTIFTLGLLAWTEPRLPKALVVIPAIWSLIGTMAALQLGMREDFALVVSLLTTLLVLSSHARMNRRQPVPTLQAHP